MPNSVLGKLLAADLLEERIQLFPLGGELLSLGRWISPRRLCHLERFGFLADLATQFLD